MCLFGVLGVEAGVLSPEVAEEIQSFSASALMIFRIGSGARPRETRAFHVMATLEGGMMLARAYRSIEAFDQAAASLTT
jgi:TetR/AcrR family transcriptional repressor of nem operon